MQPITAITKMKRKERAELPQQKHKHPPGYIIHRHTERYL